MTKSIEQVTMTIPFNAITVDEALNIRTNYEEESIKGLAASIKQYGLLQAPVVRDLGEGVYTLVAGYRRMRALQSLGYTEAQFAVIEADEKDAAVINLVENVNRETLTSFELAMGCKRLRDEHEMTGEQISKHLKGEGLEGKGKSKQNVNNLIRLLDVLDDRIVQAWKDGHEKATTYNLLRVASKEDTDDQWEMWEELCGISRQSEDGDEGEEGEEGEGDGKGGEGVPAPKPKSKGLVDVLAMIGAIKKAVKDDSIEASDGEAMINALQWVAGKRKNVPGVKPEHFE